MEFAWQLCLLRWRRLGDGVRYYHCKEDLYIVSESDGRHSASPPSYSFYHAKNTQDLRTQYYGDYND